jgi:uncharacterized OsmC-like protein
MAQTEIRNFSAGARSTDTFGRVQCDIRNHHFIVDGPVQNGCPGEAVTPAELFLASIAACGVELVQVLARNAKVTLRSVAVEITGLLDRNKPVRPDLTLLNSVALRFQLSGVTAAEGASLIARFKDT